MLLTLMFLPTNFSNGNKALAGILGSEYDFNLALIA
jgi:hypothetical protein